MTGATGATVEPSRMTPTQALHLERTIGNSALARWLKAKQQNSAPTIQRVKQTASVDATQDSFMRNLQFVSGHGTFCPAALKQKGLRDKVRVPSGTTVTFWLPHGAALNDWSGQQVETGGNFANLIELYKEVGLALEVYEPSNEIPNYTLTPGKGLTMAQQPGSKSFIADQTYTLEDLMQQFRGKNIHWVACRSVSATVTADELWGAAKGNRESSDRLAYAKQTLWAGQKNRENFQAQMGTLGATIVGDVKLRGRQVGQTVKNMDIDELKAAMRETLAQSPSKPEVFEAFGAYSMEHTPQGQSDARREYKKIEFEIDRIAKSYGEVTDMAAANQTTPDGLIQQQRDKLARLEAEKLAEEQTQGNAADQDKIDDLEEDVFTCESELRMVEGAIDEYQSLAELKKKDEIHKQKYIKREVDDPAWRERFR